MTVSIYIYVGTFNYAFMCIYIYCLFIYLIHVLDLCIYVMCIYIHDTTIIPGLSCALLDLGLCFRVRERVFNRAPCENLPEKDELPFCHPASVAIRSKMSSAGRKGL